MLAVWTVACPRVSPTADADSADLAVRGAGDLQVDLASNRAYSGSARALLRSTLTPTAPIRRSWPEIDVDAGAAGPPVRHRTVVPASRAFTLAVVQAAVVFGSSSYSWRTNEPVMPSAVAVPSVVVAPLLIVSPIEPTPASLFWAKAIASTQLTVHVPAGSDRSSRVYVSRAVPSLTAE